MGKDKIIIPYAEIADQVGWSGQWGKDFQRHVEVPEILDEVGVLVQISMAELNLLVNHPFAKYTEQGMQKLLIRSDVQAQIRRGKVNLTKNELVIFYEKNVRKPTSDNGG